MKMEDLMDVSELSAQEQAHLSGMMSEMMLTLTFTDDGKIFSSMDDSVVQYEVDGERLLLDGSPADFTVSPTQLTLEGNGEVLTFTRSNGAAHDGAAGDGATRDGASDEASNRTEQ